MFDVGRPALTEYALQILKPVWIEGEPNTTKFAHDIVWGGASLHKISLYARRDGYIIFDFSDSAGYSGGEVPAHVPEPGIRMPAKIIEAQKSREALRYRRLKYMNAFLACLYSSYATIQGMGIAVQPPIMPTTYFHATMNAAGLWQLYEHADIPNAKAPRSRSILPLETVANAAELMKQCDRVLSDTGIDLLALTYMACHQYGNHQFDSAHLIAWSACEILINRLWSDLLQTLDSRNGGHTSISGDRRKLLVGRDFTASMVSQALSLHGKIDDAMLERLDKARKKRNAFAHSLEPVSSGDVAMAIQTAMDLMSKVVGSKIAGQLAYSAID